MMERENERVVEAIVTAINHRDLDTVLDQVADDVTASLSGFDEIVDKAGLSECWAEWCIPFPDLSYRVDRMVSQGNTVVAEIIGTGTHEGVILGIPATNKKVETREVWIFDFEDAKVKLWKEYYNIPGFAGAQFERLLR